jgi:hypothetical protein
VGAATLTKPKEGIQTSLLLIGQVLYSPYNPVCHMLLLTAPEIRDVFDVGALRLVSAVSIQTAVGDRYQSHNLKQWNGKLSEHGTVLAVKSLVAVMSLVSLLPRNEPAPLTLPDVIEPRRGPASWFTYRA